MNGCCYDRWLAPLEKWRLGQTRRALLSHLSGRIVEIGAGTGVNFPLFAADSEILALEPDAGMREIALRRCPAQVTLTEGRAESLPLPDGWADHVVCTLVLCSVGSLSETLRETHRVLRPGGTLVFLEHVRGQGCVGEIHDWATPLWKRLAGGCHLNRRPLRALVDNDFAIESCWTPCRILATPFVAGFARKLDLKPGQRRD